MMMGVDQFARCLGEHRRRRQHGRSADGPEAREKLAPGRVTGVADWAIVEIHGRSPGCFFRNSR